MFALLRLSSGPPRCSDMSVSLAPTRTDEYDSEPEVMEFDMPAQRVSDILSIFADCPNLLDLEVCIDSEDQVQMESVENIARRLRCV